MLLIKSIVKESQKNSEFFGKYCKLHKKSRRCI